MITLIENQLLTHDFIALHVPKNAIYIDNPRSNKMLHDRLDDPSYKEKIVHILYTNQDTSTTHIATKKLHFGLLIVIPLPINRQYSPKGQKRPRSLKNEMFLQILTHRGVHVREQSSINNTTKIIIKLVY